VAAFYDDPNKGDQNDYSDQEIHLPAAFPGPLVGVVIGLPELGSIQVCEKARLEDALVMAFIQAVMRAPHALFRSPDEKLPQHGRQLKGLSPGRQQQVQFNRQLWQ
jgi:hypothetical protein